MVQILRLFENWIKGQKMKKKITEADVEFQMKEMICKVLLDTTKYIEWLMKYELISLEQNHELCEMIFQKTMEIKDEINQTIYE